MVIKRKANDSVNTLLHISSMYSSFSKVEKLIADIVLKDPEKITLSTVLEMAESASVAEASIVRFYRKLGYQGFHEFKLSIAQNLVKSPVYSDNEISETDGTAAILQKITNNNQQILQKTNDLMNLELIEKVVEQLIKANKIYIFGVGSSGITALEAHYLFMRLGLNVEAQRDPHIMVMQASLMKKEDAAVIISVSGNTKDMIESAKIVKDSGANVICLTSQAKSAMEKYSDITLLIPSKEKPLQGGALFTKMALLHILDFMANLISIRQKDKVIDSIKKTAKAVVEKVL